MSQDSSGGLCIKNPRETEVAEFKHCFKVFDKKYPQILTRLLKELPNEMLGGCILTILALNPEFREIYPTTGRYLSKKKDFIDYLIDNAKEVYRQNNK